MGVREAGQADVAVLAGLMIEFYAEAGLALHAGRAAAAFSALLADPRAGRVWLLERDGVAAGEPVAAPPDERPAAAAVSPLELAATGPPAAGYVVVTFAYAMEYGGAVAVIDDLFVRPEARGEGFGAAALAAVRRACEGLGLRAVRVEVGVDNVTATRVYEKAGFESLADHALMELRLAPPLHEQHADG